MRYISLAVPILIFCSWSTGIKADDYLTTAAFIQACDSAEPSAACIDQYLLVTITLSVDAANAGTQSNTCEPEPTPKSSDDEQTRMEKSVIVAILPWLKKHPEYSSKTDVVGISAALHALYPCK
jgi:hypothetical protein